MYFHCYKMTQKGSQCVGWELLLSRQRREDPNVLRPECAWHNQGAAQRPERRKRKTKKKNVTLSLQILDQFLASTIRTLHAEPSRAWFQLHSSLFSTTSFYTRLSITWTPGLAWFIFPWSVWRFCWHSVDRDQKYVYIHQYTGQLPYNKLHSPKCQ